VISLTPETKKARRQFNLAEVRLQEAREEHERCERELRAAQAEFDKAKSYFSTNLEIDGSSFEKWDDYRQSFRAILSAAFPE